MKKTILMSFVLFSFGCVTKGPTTEVRDHELIRRLLLASDLRVSDQARSYVVLNARAIRDEFNAREQLTNRYRLEISLKDCYSSEGYFAQKSWPISLLTLTMYPLTRPYDCPMNIRIRDDSSGKDYLIESKIVLQERIWLFEPFAAGLLLPHFFDQYDKAEKLGPILEELAIKLAVP